MSYDHRTKQAASAQDASIGYIAHALESLTQAVHDLMEEADPDLLKGRKAKITKALRVLEEQCKSHTVDSQAPKGDKVAQRVQDAYEYLKNTTHRDRVLISDLQKRSKVPMAQLHKHLEALCDAHKANPSRGEYTAATEEQQNGALMLDGEPHLYIELLA